MRVVEVRGDGTALCSDGAEVMTDLVGDVAPGDELLVHAGTAIATAAPLAVPPSGRADMAARPSAPLPENVEIESGGVRP
jgi:hypothetical protein